MSKPFLTPIDLNGLEFLNARIQNLAAAPGSPTEGRIYYDTTSHNARVYSGSGWVDIVTGSAGYTDEQAQDAIAALIAAGTQTGLTVTYNDAANTLSFTVPADGAAGTATLRTLGTGAAQAAAGNDARLSDTRTPTAGSVVNASVAVGAAISSDKLADGTTNGVYTLAERTKLAGVSNDAAAGTASQRTLGTGATQAAAGNDARLSDTRTPSVGSVVNASVAVGAGISADKLADGATNGVYTLAERTKLAGVSNDAVAGTASQRTLGTGAQQAAAGNDTRLSDARNPIAGSVTNASMAVGAAISSDKLADGTTNGVYTLAERTKLAGIATGATNYTNATALANRLDQFAAPNVALNFNGQRGTNAADPTGATDLVTKQYADGLRQGITVKDPVVVATTANITLTGEQTIDGILTAASRVLVKNQTTASQNGIYVSGSGAWIRATDADVSAELPEGAVVWIQQGTTQGNTRWVNTTAGAITLGTTSLTFTQDFAATATTAGNGLTASGNAFSVGAGSGITVAADTVSIDTAIVTRKANFSVGDGAATSYNLVHNWGTRDVMVRVYRNSTPWDDVEVDITRPDVNTVTLTFATAPAAAAFRGVVQG